MRLDSAIVALRFGSAAYSTVFSGIMSSSRVE